VRAQVLSDFVAEVMGNPMVVEVEAVEPEQDLKFDDETVK